MKKKKKKKILSINQGLFNTLAIFLHFSVILH